MAIETTYSDLREHLAEYMDRVVDDAETVVIRRRNGKNVAIVSELELNSLIETNHLIASPKNARRLLEALNDVRKGRGKPTTIEELRKEFGLDHP